MTTSGGGEERITFLADLKINVEDLQRQIKSVFGNIPELVGRASGSMGGGGGVSESGEVAGGGKEAQERSKVQTGAMKHLAQQFPGGGLMTQMAGAFKGGGMMAGLATGMTAAVGFLMQILKSSQVFQLLQGTIFKTLGFMADMFVMPFVPMMMKFVSWMLTHMPEIQEAGEKTAAFIEKIASVFSWGQDQKSAGKERGGPLGWMQERVGESVTPGGIFKTLSAMSGGQGNFFGQKLTGMQMGGKVPGSPGEGVNAQLHGGEIVIPQDIASGAKNMGGRVASWIERFEQKEMGSGGVIAKWYDEMFGNSIIPKMWGDIRGLFQGIESESETVGRQVTSSTTNIEADQKGFWSKLKFWEQMGEGWGKIKDCFNLIKDKIFDFFTFDIDFPGIPSIDWDSLMSKLGDVGTAIKDWSKGLWDWVMPDLPEIDISWSGIWDRMKSVGTVVQEFFTKTLWGGVKTAFDGLTAAAGSVGSFTINIGSGIKDCFIAAKDSVIGFFTSIPGKLMGVVRKIASWRPSFPSATDLYGGIRDKLDSIVADITSKIKGLAGNLNPVSWFNNAFGSLRGTVPRRGGPGSRSGSGAGAGAGAGAGNTGDTGDTGGTGDTGDVGNNGVGSGVVVTTATGGIRESGERVVNDADDSAGSQRQSSTPAFNAYMQTQASMGGGPGRAFTASLAANTSAKASGGMFQFDQYSYSGTGEAFGRLSSSSNSSGGRTNIANRTVNVSIISNQSVTDIVSDIERLQSMDEASFFNSVS